MRPQGSPAELERRRLRAITLLDQGLLPHEVAERLGVDRRSVRRWKRAYRRRGRAGVTARPIPGRPPKLTARQRDAVAHAILGRSRSTRTPTAASSRSSSGAWTS